MLINDFYSVKEKHVIEKGFEVDIVLNSNHLIFACHFPNKKITPGVCIIQICKELLMDHLKLDLLFKYSKNIKFLNIIDPTIDNIVRFKFLFIDINEDNIKVEIIIQNNDIVFTKINSVYEIKWTLTS